MPAGSRREHILIRVFLSSYEHNSWVNCKQESPEKLEDGAVEIFATRESDGQTLAIEHTLIQPFVKDKEDFAKFEKFLCIEEDRSLIVPGRIIWVWVPVGALQKGYSWDLVVTTVHQWLKTNILSFPEGLSDYVCPIGNIGKRNANDVNLRVVVQIPKYPASSGYGDGAFIIRRYGDERLDEVVEKALKDKLPKLVNTEADKRILLLERDQPTISPLCIYNEIKKRRAMFPDLAKVHEIWFADTAFEKAGYVRCELYDDNHPFATQTLGFLEGRLIERSENGIPSSDVSIFSHH